MLVGVDIGGTKIAVMVVRDETILGSLVRPTNKKKLVDSVKGTILAAFKEIGANSKEIEAIGIGVPGMVDPELGTVNLAVNLDITEPFPLGERLSAEFNCPVLLENDVRIAVLATHKLFALSSIAYLSIGTGAAAGLVLNNALWRGANGLAGEISFSTIDREGTVFADIITGPAIIHHARKRGINVERAGDLFQMAADGKPNAVRYIDQVSEHIGRMIQWLILTYDVEKVVLGGGVTKIGEPFLTPILRELARLRTQSPLNHHLLPDSRIALLPADFNPGLHGAITLASSAL